MAEIPLPAGPMRRDDTDSGKKERGKQGGTADGKETGPPRPFSVLSGRMRITGDIAFLRNRFPMNTIIYIKAMRIKNKQIYWR